MLTDCINVIIDGFPDYLHKLSVVERPQIPSPKRQINTTQVNGRLGSLVQRYSFDDVEFKIDFNYLEEVLDYQSFKEKFYIVRHWLYNAKELQFSDEPNIKYLVQNIEIDDAENDIIEFGSFTATVTVKPFGRVIEETPITVNNPFSFDLLNNAFTSSYPIIQFIPTKTTATITVNDSNFNFENLIVGEKVILDSDTMMFYTIQSDGDVLDYSNKMLTLEYPIFNSEINHIACTNIKQIEIFRNAMR